MLELKNLKYFFFAFTHLPMLLLNEKSYPSQKNQMNANNHPNFQRGPLQQIKSPNYK